MMQEPDDFGPPRPEGILPWWVVWLLLIALAVMCGFMGAALAEDTKPGTMAGLAVAGLAAGVHDSLLQKGSTQTPNWQWTLIAESATPVQPKRECGPREAMLEFARRMFHESPVAALPAQSGTTLVITLSDAKSWTAMACTQAVCCVVGSGQNAQFLKGA